MFRNMRAKLTFFAALAIMIGVPLALGAQDVPPPKGEVIDSIIARVNDAIITSHDYKQAQQALKGEIKQDCKGCSAAQLEAKFNEEKKNVLRDLIDQQLLVQRAKDDGINVDADVIRQLNTVREKYNLASMNALRRAVEASGMSWNDYKDSIKRQLLTQKLVQQDVGGTIQISHEQVQKYYEAHKSEFNLPESVVIREIILSTKGKTPKQDAEIKKKIEMIRQRILNGDDFGQLAKLYSDGPTAKEEGELGKFTRGQLAKPIEDAVFKLQHNQMTPVMQLANGYAIFQVERHYDAGIQPVDKVEPQIEQAIYMKKIGPALRKFLKVLRQQSYIRIQPGYTDTAAVAETPIEEVVPGSSDSGKKGKKKKGEE
jgi:peptidyl-prolyl cis-trans isomerase SurA